MGSMDGKVCIVTGASSGIGRETALGLARLGASVVLVCRDKERCRLAIAHIRSLVPGAKLDSIIADLASQDSIRDCAAKFRKRYKRLDVLVNNAGSMNTTREVNEDGIEMTFAVNHLGYFLLTQELLDILKRSAPSRIVNVASEAHRGARMHFDDIGLKRGYSIMKAYGQSKLANILFTYELATRLEGSGVTANCLHPGVVSTRFWDNKKGFQGKVLALLSPVIKMLMISSEKGAETSIYLASSDEVRDVSGQYFDKKRSIPSSPISYDKESGQRLWEISEELTRRKKKTKA